MEKEVFYHILDLSVDFALEVWWTVLGYLGRAVAHCFGEICLGFPRS